MTTSRRLAPLPLLLTGLAAIAVLVVIPWIVQAQSQEVTPTAAATGETPPAQPTNLQAAAEHDAVTLTWTASTDQSVTHYAILRRNRDTEALGVFQVIESNAGPETSYTDSSVSTSSTYIYRVKSVSPTGVSQWSGYVKAETSGPTPTPTSTPTPEPESRTDPVDPAPTNLTAALAGGGGANLSRTSPVDDADSVTGYGILRAAGQGDPTSPVAGTGSTDTAYTHATAWSSHTATSETLDFPSGHTVRRDGHRRLGLHRHQRQVHPAVEAGGHHHSARSKGHTHRGRGDPDPHPARDHRLRRRRSHLHQGRQQANAVPLAELHRLQDGRIERRVNRWVFRATEQHQMGMAG